VAGAARDAFAVSTTVWVLGFSEQGLQPAPHAALSVGAEVLTVLLWAGDLATARGREVHQSA
jgi:hypothetical protein